MSVWMVDGRRVEWRVHGWGDRWVNGWLGEWTREWMDRGLG